MLTWDLFSLEITWYLYINKHTRCSFLSRCHRRCQYRIEANIIEDKFEDKLEDTFLTINRYNVIANVSKHLITWLVVIFCRA